MATTNPVQQILATSGDQSLLAAGSRVTALAVGQLGIFNYHTGLSVDGSVLADCRDIFFAVGLNKTGAGGGATLEDINKSAGEMVQVRNSKSLTWRGYTAGRPKIVDIDNFGAKCSTDYLVKIEFRNSKVYGLYGYNQFTKTFNFQTSCCTDDCTDCPTGSCSELATGILTAINADPDGLVTASYVANKIIATINTAPTADGNTVVTIGTTTYTVAVLDLDTTAQAAQKIVDAINAQDGSPYSASLSGSTITVYERHSVANSTATFAVSGSGVTANAITGATKTAIADLAAWLVLYPDACPSLRLTSQNDAINNYGGNVNLKYYKNRVTDIIVSTPQGFTDACNGTVTDIQYLLGEEGLGYDLRQLEYEAGGWNGKPGPYRASDTVYLDRSGYEFYINKTTHYKVINLTYDQMAVGGWLEYLNNLSTIIAIPCLDTTTATSLAAIMDLIFTQFGAMANDNSAIGDCSTPVVTSAQAANVDGIESLA